MNAGRPSLQALAVWLLVAGALCNPRTTHAAALAHNENFVVLAPGQTLADAVLARAESLREQIAKEWFGQVLEAGAGRTLIHVELSRTQDSGFTWVMDSPDRVLHNVWLTATRDQALGGVLGHEVTHAVFATKFPDRLPLWIEEGIACLQDGRQRSDARRDILRRVAQRDNSSAFEQVFNSRAVRTGDPTTYTVAASVVEYLLARGDKATLLRFAVAAQQKGWDRALEEHYGLRSRNDLRLAWQSWVREPSKPYAYTPPPGSDTLTALRRRP